jgi:hypothetical protein
LATLTIDPADWCRFERLVGDTEATRIIGHDDPEDGMMTVYIACALLMDFSGFSDATQRMTSAMLHPISPHWMWC